ncbi:Panacea domain-containing protein [Tundrisphaera lichenicola]|uniref:Panacea domain-containing protein n=1 Tax=Tundrisphaera lichenicola TaxID=2029860 RepID=UPI003EBAA0EA
MRLRFNFEKSLQAAGVLLRLEEGRMSYMRLLKLLYIADREMLAATAASITGDQGFAMKYGPVLSHVYDLIQGAGSRFDDWDRHIRTQGYAVKLVEDPGRGKLSRGEIEKLTEVSDRHRSKDQWELSDLTHDFPEWRRHWPEGAEVGSYLIPWEDILAAQGEGRETIEVVEEEEAARNYMEDLFGPAR